jgi:spermidine synthase
MADFFESQNQGVLSRPHFRVFMNDARDHLHVSNLKYDVIATDVTNLQYKQNALLYTREYFQLMRDRLNADGIACGGSSRWRWELADQRSKRVSRIAVDMDQVDTAFAILIGTQADSADGAPRGSGAQSRSRRRSRKIKIGRVRRCSSCCSTRRATGHIQVKALPPPVLEFLPPRL